MTATSARWFAGAIAALEWCALALQLELIVLQAAELAIPAPLALIGFASFFTIQVNLLVAIVTSLVAGGARGLATGGRFRSALAVYVVTAGMIFFVILRPAW